MKLDTLNVIDISLTKFRYDLSLRLSFNCTKKLYTGGENFFTVSIKKHL